MVDGFDHAMTANSFTSVSLDPEMVLFCVQKDSRFREAISVAPRWDRESARCRSSRRRAMVRRARQALERQMQVVEHTRDEDGIPALDGCWLFELHHRSHLSGATTASVVGRGGSCRATMQLRRWSSSNAVSPGCRQQDFGGGRRANSRAKTPQTPVPDDSRLRGCHDRRERYSLEPGSF